MLNYKIEIKKKNIWYSTMNRLDKIDKILNIANKICIVLTVILFNYNIFINEKCISFINNTHFSAFVYIPILILFSYFHAIISVSYFLLPFVQFILIIDLLTYNL